MQQILGIINNAIPFTMIFAGQTVIGAGLASILNATTPLWTVLVAQVFTEDPQMDPEDAEPLPMQVLLLYIMVNRLRLKNIKITQLMN